MEVSPFGISDRRNRDLSLSFNFSRGFSFLGWINLLESITKLPKTIWIVNTLKTVVCEGKACIFAATSGSNQRVGWAAYAVLEKGLTISF